MESKKEQLRRKRQRSARLKMCGTKERPRLAVHRSLTNMSAQVIDDNANTTLFSLSTHDKDVREKFAYAGNVKAAGYFGEVFARKAKEKGISAVVFDRAGYLYHGRIKAFADSARKGGLQF
jgi:large subunit ribosomal protein L18